MMAPWQVVDPLPPRDFAALRREAIFACCKWDPQIEDVCALSAHPIVLRSEAWAELCLMAEELAVETIQAEQEILRKPALLKRLALPWRLRNQLSRMPADGSSGGVTRDVRLIRFDFHFTPEGWRISEANSDVPGGFNEASGFTRLAAERFGHAAPAGDPTRELAVAVASSLAQGTHKTGNVALVHATAFTDDRQVMEYFSRSLRALGLNPLLLAPDHLRWIGPRPFAGIERRSAPLDFVFRFFPAEWLPNLPKSCSWWRLLGDSIAGLCNPGTSIVTQSKRFPLLWEDLAAPMNAWRRLLPRTTEPRAAAKQFAGKSIVWKSALGRVGDFIRMDGITSAKEAKEIARDVRWNPGAWIAQERFETVPMRTSEGDFYPCIGVYTVNGKAAGAYGRLGRTPLINHLAQDAAVLIADPGGQNGRCPINGATTLTREASTVAFAGRGGRGESLP